MLGHKMAHHYRDVVEDLLNMHIEQHRSISELVFYFGTASEQDPGANVDDSTGKKDETQDLDWWNIVMRLEKCKA